MDAAKVSLHELLDIENPQAILVEIEHIVSLLTREFDLAVLRQGYADIIRLFNGQFPGYQASNTAYHDLSHTTLVALAMSRLMHGLAVDGHRFTGREVLLGIMTALFHDTGLIQAVDDTVGTGAKYTIGHEERSIARLRSYLATHDFTAAEIEEGASIIRCTVLNNSIAGMQFPSAIAELLGKILGSADLLAQMADRKYLEKLPLLFQEFEEAGIPGYKSELELLKKTEQFYRSVAQTKLSKDFDNVAAALRLHFRERWGADRDLYAEAIAVNIKHLGAIGEVCREQYECYLDSLRRGGIISELIKKK